MKGSQLDSYHDNGNEGFQERAALIMIASGLAIIATIFLFQYVSIMSLLSSNNNGITLTSEQIQSFNRVALPTLAIILIGLTISIRGAINLLKSWRHSIYRNSKQQRKLRVSIAKALWDSGQSQKIFTFSTLLYAILFLWTSNTFIFSGSNLSDRYGVQIPSSYILGCCGQPGNFPVITVYLSEHFGLLLVPLNIVLAAFLPILVGINISLIYYKIRLSRNSESCSYSYMSSWNKKWQTKDGSGTRRMHKIISGCGFATGIFAACPACAGSVLFSSLFGSGTVLAGAMTASVAGYQPEFAILSVGTLLVAPFIVELKK